MWSLIPTTTGLSIPLDSAAVHWSARGWGVSPGRAVLPGPCILPLWPRLTLPLALPLHHDVPVQRPGHGVGKLGALQERRHGAAGGDRAVGARLCRWLPDLGPGLRGGGRSGGARRAGRKPPARCPGHVPTARPGPQRGSSACAGGGLGAPAPCPPPGRRPLPTRLLVAFSAASRAPGPRRHIRPLGRILPESGRTRARGLGWVGRRGGAGGSARDGCPRCPNASVAPRPRTAKRPYRADPAGGVPDVAGPGLLREARGARERGRGGCSETAFIGSLEIRVSNNCTEARPPAPPSPLPPGPEKQLHVGYRETPLGFTVARTETEIN